MIVRVIRILDPVSSTATELWKTTEPAKGNICPGDFYQLVNCSHATPTLLFFIEFEKVVHGIRYAMDFDIPVQAHIHADIHTYISKYRNNILKLKIEETLLAQKLI